MALRADALLAALGELVENAEDLRPAAQVQVPDPPQLRLSQEMLPRDAFFGRTEDVDLTKAAGRIAAEMLTHTRRGSRRRCRANASTRPC